ncbi:hypothetical protein LY15_002413 [Prauserella flava]|nr:hypothetical protein [Prauserella flava]MCR3733851.1 hypothetical protein [Prauserella salsuginis]
MWLAWGFAGNARTVGPVRRRTALPRAHRTAPRGLGRPATAWRLAARVGRQLLVRRRPPVRSRWRRSRGPLRRPAGGWLGRPVLRWTVLRWAVLRWTLIRRRRSRAGAPRAVRRRCLPALRRPGLTGRRGAGALCVRAAGVAATRRLLARPRIDGWPAGWRALRPLLRPGSLRRRWRAATGRPFGIRGWRHTPVAGLWGAATVPLWLVRPGGWRGGRTRRRCRSGARIRTRTAGLARVAVGALPGVVFPAVAIPVEGFGRLGAAGVMAARVSAARVGVDGARILRRRLRGVTRPLHGVIPLGCCWPPWPRRSSRPAPGFGWPARLSVQRVPHQLGVKLGSG